jgi:hypothetical protein
MSALSPTSDPSDDTDVIRALATRTHYRQYLQPDHWAEFHAGGLRIQVATVVKVIAEEMCEGEILQAYSDVDASEIRAALPFAAGAVHERELPLIINW